MLLSTFIIFWPVKNVVERFDARNMYLANGTYEGTLLQVSGAIPRLSKTHPSTLAGFSVVVPFKLTKCSICDLEHHLSLTRTWWIICGTFEVTAFFITSTIYATPTTQRFNRFVLVHHCVHHLVSASPSSWTRSHNKHI